MKHSALLLSLLLAASCLVAGAKPSRQDILMIAIDDLRPMLGCYGDPHIQTPNIDRLGRCLQPQ